MGHDEELKLLDEAIANRSNDVETTDLMEIASLYFQRGKLLYRMGEFGRSKNDLLKVSELLESPQVPPEQNESTDEMLKTSGEYIKMIENILEFRYTDTYNP